MKYITLPNKITEVGKCAFKNCNSLEAINIPENVKCIGRYAFSNCSNLNTITFYNPECSIYNEYETISGEAKIIGYIGSTAQADGYQIQYSASSSFKSAKTVTVKGNKNTVKTVSKLRGKKKYYVRVRAYKKNGNTTYFSAWSKTKKIKTSK